MRDRDAQIDAYLDGLLDPAACVELERWIESDTAHARLVAEYALLHRHLVETRRNSELGTRNSERSAVAALPVPRSAFRVPSFALPVAYAAAAILLLAAAAATIYVLALSDDPRTQTPEPARASLAVLLESAGVEWRSDPIEPGDSVLAGDLDIASGRIGLDLNGGTSVELVGPARMSINADDAVRLDRGTLLAVARPGFTVDTPAGVRVTDLGTRFVVRVAPDGSVAVGVHEGLVRTRSADDAAAVDLPARCVMLFDSAGSLVERIDEPAGVDTAALYLPATVSDADGQTSYPSLTGGPMLEPAGDGVYVGDLPLGDATDNWLIEARVRADSTEGLSVIAYHGDPSRSGYGMVRQGDQWTVVFGGIVVLRFGATVEIGRWTRLAAVRQSGVTRLYVNGQPVGASSAAVPHQATTRLRIGGLAGVPGQRFEGVIDRVRVARLTTPFDPDTLNIGAPSQTPPRDTNENPYHESQED